MSKQENLDRLVGFLKNRLRSSGKEKIFDTNGNGIYIDADIYGKEVLESFLELSVSNFNQVPTFTSFTLKNDDFVDLFADVLVEGATLYALSSQALIERGREFQTTLDNSINLNPLSIADMLNVQYSMLLAHYWEKVKTIKARITEFKK